jgi:hypothetical protein
MFLWSKKTRKSVTFHPEVADESLLAVVETELVKQPHKTFSDLCKEALWQFLCVPASVRPTPTPMPEPVQTEQLMADLQRQLADFEQRFFAKESQRLEAMERQLNQLTQQLAQLSLIVNQLAKPEPIVNHLPKPEPIVNQLAKPEPVPRQIAPKAEAESPPSPPPEIDDPLLSRLSAFLDDF